jgi:hypothetical protein
MVCLYKTRSTPVRATEQVSNREVPDVTPSNNVSVKGRRKQFSLRRINIAAEQIPSSANVTAMSYIKSRIFAVRMLIMESPELHSGF